MGAFAIGFTIFITLSSPTEDNATERRLAPLFAVTGILIILQTMRKKVIINDNSITYVGVFRQKKILFEDIDGVTIDSKHIDITSNSPHKKDLRIPDYIQLAESKQLVNYLKSSFYKMDHLNQLRAQADLLYDSTYGFTPEQRVANNRKLMKFANVINIIGLVLAAAIFAIPLLFVKAIVIVFPLLCILIVFGTNKRIKIYPKYTAVGMPVINTAFILPIVALFFKSIIDYDLYNSNNLWIPCLIIAAVLIIICYIANAEEVTDKYKNLYILGSVTLWLVYSFGSVRIINCAFDKSEGVIYKPLITKKYTLLKYVETTTKTEYDINLTAWGQDKTTGGMEISKERYQKVNVGDTIYINVKPGLLNIPWYKVQE